MVIKGESDFFRTPIIYREGFRYIEELCGVLKLHNEVLIQYR